jgi:histidine triad (HIT) family protein
MDYGSLLLWLVRSWLGRVFVQWAFTTMSFAIPVKRLHETDTLLAFHHPKPSHPVHVLVVPKRRYSSLLDIPPDDVEFFHDLFDTVRRLVREFDLDQGGYRLIVNGGTYQDVPHLHFHLVSDVSDVR